MVAGFLGNIDAMKLALAVTGLVGLAVMSAYGVQQLNRGEQFRVLMASGDEALGAGNSYAAVAAYSGAMALRSGSMVSHLRRGQAYEAQRRQEEAVRDYLEAARLQPGAADPLLALAGLYAAQGDMAHAAEWYGRAAIVDPQNPALLYQLALARYRGGQAATAIDPVRRALALDPGFDEAHYLLGVLLHDAHDLDGATASLERAIAGNPAFMAAREELAEVYRARRRFADEMGQLTAIAAADNRGVRAVAIALAEARQGNFESALATLTKAQALDPADSTVALARGRVYLMQAEAATDPARRTASARLALPPLEAALGGSARRSEGLTLYGRAVHLTGNAGEAERLLKEAVATTPFDRAAFAYLADAAEQLGHYADARDWLSRFDALEGDTATAAVRTARLRRLGGLALAGGDAPGAVAALEDAYKRGLRDATMLGWLADARWRTGNAAGAKDALSQALALTPNDPVLRRLRQSIR